jgi:TRAP-type mannitol/chloroaromatic compound transport system permease large subunit
MMHFVAENIAPIMFLGLVVVLLLGYPVAFSLAFVGLSFFAIGVELAPYSDGAITLSWPLLYALPDNFFGSRVMSNEVLLAIPFFTFMGLILERSGMAEDLLDTIGQLFGPVRGGLAYAVIFVGALLAATTGVVAASVIAMGLISLPIMLRYGYDRRVASGVIAASGTLAQIIPPSLVLIVLADQLGRSVGDMYKGAIIPGLVLTGMYVGYIVLISVFRPSRVPALPPAARALGTGVTSLLVAVAAGLAIALGLAWGGRDWLGHNTPIWSASIAIVVVYGAALIDKAAGLNLMSHLARQVIVVLIPPLALVFLVLGTIFVGIATPTEGGAMGAVGALLMAIAKRRLNLDLLRQALAATTRLSSFVLFILIGARVFSLTFYGVNGHLWVEHLLVSLPGGEYGFLIVVSILVFLLAFFLDFFELAFIIVPLLGPVADKLGIDLIWFGVILGVNMQTSFMHPPFGFALFYLRSVAPKVPYTDKVTGQRTAPVTTGQIYWGAVPFVIIQVIMVGVVIAFPAMVMHYKNRPPLVLAPSSTVAPAGPVSPGGLGTPNFGASAPAAPGSGAPAVGTPGFGATPSPGPAVGTPSFGSPAPAPAAPAPPAPAPAAPAPAAPAQAAPAPAVGAPSFGAPASPEGGN